MSGVWSDVEGQEFVCYECEGRGPAPPTESPDYLVALMKFGQEHARACYGADQPIESGPKSGPGSGP